MRALHHPAPRLGPGVTLGANLLAARAQVQGEAELLGQNARLVVVEALRYLSKKLSGAHQAASLISWSLMSRSGLRQTSPTGAQFRIWRDHRAGLAARASV